MSTNSMIVKQCENGKYKGVYCHWDGYPSHVGTILRNYYTSESKIDNLLRLGALSALGESPTAVPQEFRSDTYRDYYICCKAYHRDRGEKKIPAQTVTNFNDFRFGFHYVYLFKDGKWLCYKLNKDRFDLVEISDAQHEEYTKTYDRMKKMLWEQEKKNSQEKKKKNSH